MTKSLMDTLLELLLCNDKFSQFLHFLPIILIIASTGTRLRHKQLKKRTMPSFASFNYNTSSL